MSTQGKGTYVINSGWSSGSLVFYEKAVGRTATGDVFTIGASQVTIGGTGQDVDFLVYLGSANNYFKLDCGAATAAFYGVDVTVTGDLTIASEDLALGDDCSLEFGASTDVTMTWLGSTNILAILPATDDTGAIQFGNGTKDMDVKIFLGSASNYVDFNVGDSQMALVGVDITTGSPVVITDATATSSTSTGALIVTGGIGFGGDMYVGDDIFLTSGAILSFDAGDVTLTHSANTLAIAGASVGVTADGPIIVTVAALTAGDAYSGIKSSVTCAAPNNAIGAAGYVEATYTGTGAGHFYAFGSWINFGAAAVTGAYHVCAQDNGIYGTVTATNTRLIFGLKMEAIITGTPAAFCPFYLGTSNKAITALFDIASGPAIGAASASSGTITGKVPLYVDSAGTVKYVAVYDSLT